MQKAIVSVEKQVSTALRISWFHLATLKANHEQTFQVA